MITTTIAAPADQRQQRAAALAAAGAVALLADGSFSVQSQTRTDTRYHVTADYRCECPDAARGHLCKHALAARALARAVADAKAALAAGRLGDLERLARNKSRARSQFEHDTLTIRSLACQVVKARQRFACIDLIPAATAADWQPVSTREERERAPFAGYRQPGSGRIWKTGGGR